MTLVGGTLAYLFLPFPWWLVVIGGLIGIQVAEVLLFLSVRGRAPVAGAEALIGQEVILVTPERARMNGTTYPVRSAGGATGEPGEVVVVEAVDGIVLVVRPQDGSR